MSGTTPESLRNGLALATATTVLVPLAAAALVALGVGRRSPRTLGLVALLVALAASLLVTAMWHAGPGEPVMLGERLGGGAVLHVDGLTAVLLPYAALIAVAVQLVAPRRALDADAVVRTLCGAAGTFAILATAHPLVLIGLWVATALPTWLSTRATPGGRPAARVFAIAMSAALVCMAVGTCLLVADPPWERSGGMIGAAGGWLVAVAVMIRKGIFPFHSWYPALFTGAPLSTALMATQPQVAAYTAVRLLVGHADGVARELVFLADMALVTAVYGAALAVVQRDLRGFIGTLAMSQSALVLAGLSGTESMELNGAFCIWISSGLAITGIGLVTWALESRAGAIPLDVPQGRFWDAPALAAFFLLFGVAGIGLPGTLSFVADDLIVSGSLADNLVAGLAVIVSTVLCGIAVMRCWFHVFGGPTATDGPKHAILTRERVALTGLLATLIGLGIVPGPLVTSLDRTAVQILRSAPDHAPETSPPDEKGILP
jgi:NADH-quinone oxidoreductase subunit M